MTDIMARFKADPLTLVRAALLPAPPHDIAHDDYDLHPELRSAEQTQAEKAAVLVPIIARPEPTTSSPSARRIWCGTAVK